MSDSKKIADYASFEWGENQFVVSPCVSVCQMDGSSGLCQGCFRTINEIAGWSKMDNGEKRKVWERVVQRAKLGAGE